MFLLYKPNFIGAFQSLDANFKLAAGLSAVIAMSRYITLSRPAPNLPCVKTSSDYSKLVA
jgi:hypothetical protein